MERLPKKSYCKPCYKLCQRSLSTLLGIKFFNCHKHCNKYFNKHYLILYACVKNYVSHIPQPPKPVTIPLSSKKKTKKNKKKTRKQQKQKQKQKKQQKNQKNNKKKPKKQKKPKTRTTHAHFFTLQHGSERSKRYIYIFIRTQSIFRLSG